MANGNGKEWGMRILIGCCFGLGGFGASQVTVANEMRDMKTEIIAKITENSTNIENIKSNISDIKEEIKNN